MRIRRREFIGVVGGAFASARAANLSAADGVREASSLDSHANPAEEKRYTVTGGGVAVELSSRGNIVGMGVISDGLHRAVRGRTALAECELNGEVTSKELPGGGVEFRKPISFQRGFQAATLVERFLPTADSVRWEIELQGKGDPWATSIETHLKWPEASSTKFWTAWGDNGVGKIVEAMDSTGKGWTDPTVPMPFRDLEFQLGGYFLAAPGISVPMATVIDDAHDSAITLALSPEDTLIDVRLATGADGSFAFFRLNNKIGKNQPVRFAMDLVAHAGDWRPGLEWMVKRYPHYFTPANATADEASGAGAYSAFTGDLDVGKFRKMAYKVNWQASFDWPYFGMYLPPVAEGTEWTSWYHKPVSAPAIDGYCRRMSAEGFHVLCYFCITDFGAAIKYPEPPSHVAEVDLWQDPNAFLYRKLASGILYAEDGKPIWDWYDCVLMDPGDRALQDFWVEQAERCVRQIPHSSGICIDRMDQVMRFNYRADDGVTWLYIGTGRSQGRPARSLINSWKETLGRIGPIMHNAGKAIFGNTGCKRLDLMREVDGLLDEFGYYGFNLNQDSFLGVLKPVIAWTSDKTQLQPNPDEFFQRHLFMGAFPMVPYPENDHAIVPDEWAERFYLDYGPLLDELRGRKWVLKPHVITVERAAAKANIFQTPNGYAIPVTFGGQAERVTVVVRGLPVVSSPQDYRMECLAPGSSEWHAVESRRRPDSLALTVPLTRGCAVVRVVHA